MPRLSRARILRAAQAVVRRDGPSALSMRRLAQELDVWPMSLYTYFRDKDELLAALADAVAGSVQIPPAGETWRERLISLLAELREALERDGGGLAQRPGAGLLNDGGLAVTEAALAVLRDAGFEPDAAAGAWRALAAYTVGFAVYPGGDPGERGRSVRLALAAFPGGPLSGLERALTADEEFERGLEWLLEGLQAQIAAGA